MAARFCQQIAALDRHLRGPERKEGRRNPRAAAPFPPPSLFERIVPMRFLFATACAFGLLASINTAHAVGCLTGAVAGGIAGHYAGHHAVLGAVAGCAAGHHVRKTQERRKREELQKQNHAPPPAQ
jgi:hypothetical protein